MVSLVRRLGGFVLRDTAQPAWYLGVPVVALGVLPAVVYGAWMLANIQISFNPSGLGLFFAVLSIGIAIGVVVRFKTERREAWFSDGFGLIAAGVFFASDRSSIAVLWLGFVLAGLLSDYFASHRTIEPVSGTSPVTTPQNGTLRS